MEWNYTDDPKVNGEYLLYMKIEKDTGIHHVYYVAYYDVKKKHWFMINAFSEPHISATEIFEHIVGWAEIPLPNMN